MALFLSVRVFCYDSRLKVNFNFIPINKKEKRKTKKDNHITPKGTYWHFYGDEKRNTISYVSKKNIRIAVMQLTY